MDHVFNIANITGSSFADWKPGGGQQRPVFKRLRAAPAAPEKSTTINQETEVMGTRSDIRAALSNGRVSYTRLKELLKGKNIATPLSQMKSEGTIIRSDEADGTYYELGREPGSDRKPRKSPGKAAKKASARKSATKKRTTFKFKKVDRTAAAASPDIHLTPVIADLRARRELLDKAISALEQLAH